MIYWIKYITENTNEIMVHRSEYNLANEWN